MENELAQLESQIKATKEEATHEESKPENEYDTRALETGYLVKALSKRILDTKESLAAFKHALPRDYGPRDPVGSTALLQVELGDRSSWFLYMAAGGGLTTEAEGIKIQVITPSSPIGQALLGLKEGDIATVENGNVVKEYEILKVY